MNIDSCVFIDNSALKGCDIYVLTENKFPISINKCFFNSHQKISTLSMIYFEVTFKNKSIHYFTNNEVFINLPNTVLFNGEFTGSEKFCWNFKMNCIYPYDEKHFKNSNVNFYDQTGNNLVGFRGAFIRDCYETLVVTQSIEFSNSNVFSESDMMSESFLFTQSNDFTKSEFFTQINDFTKSHFSSDEQSSLTNDLSSDEQLSLESYLKSEQSSIQSD